MQNSADGRKARNGKRSSCGCPDCQGTVINPCREAIGDCRTCGASLDTCECMAMTDEQDRNYEAAVRHAAETIDSQAASDTRYILAKLDVARSQIKERDLIIQRLSSRYWPQEMHECLLAIINLDEKGMSPSNALIDRAKAAIGYCVSARCSNDAGEPRRD